MKWNRLIAELKRRRVFKSTIAYLAISWVIIQIASIIFPVFDAPNYSLKALIYFLCVGLVLWIAFSWVYDITDQGIKKTDDLEFSEESHKLANRTLNTVIASALGIAVTLLLGVSFWMGSTFNTSKQTTKNIVIAVLPIISSSETGEDDYFANGMTEALINELSKIDQLTVINQASSRVLVSGFHTSNRLFSNIINGIDYFVEAKVNRQDRVLDVQAELKESINGDVLWRKNYTRDISEVRILWAEVATDLASQLGIVVNEADVLLWNEIKPVNPEAYELYLKGRNFLNKSTPEEMQKGMFYLQQALDENPADPHAWAWLAEAYVDLGHGPDPPQEVYSKALEAAKRAIQLDSTIALGWAALSHYHTYFGRDWALAEYAFKRANELDPNLSQNHYHRAWFLALFGRMNEAIEEHKRAQQLNPFEPLNTGWLGELYRLVGLYDEGLIEAEKAAQMEGEYALSMFIKGRIFIDQGKVEEGLESLKGACEIHPGWKFIGYGPALIQTGHLEEGKAIIEELENKNLNGFRALCLAIMYAELKDFDKTFEYLNYKDQHGWFPWIRIMFLTDDIRMDPRFLKIIRDMNLPDPTPLIYEFET